MISSVGLRLPLDLGWKATGLAMANLEMRTRGGLLTMDSLGLDGGGDDGGVAVAVAAAVVVACTNSTSITRDGLGFEEAELQSFSLEASTRMAASTSSFSACCEAPSL